MVILLALIFKIHARQFVLHMIKISVRGRKMAIRDDSVKMLHSIKIWASVEKKKKNNNRKVRFLIWTKGVIIK